MRRFLLTIALVTLGCATQDVVTDRLEMSPRHSEWAQIERAGRTIQTWVAYPEVATKAPVVILIHENRGLTDWERGVADRLAENGYIAIAPNMLRAIARRCIEQHIDRQALDVLRQAEASERAYLQTLAGTFSGGDGEAEDGDGEEPAF